MEQKLAQLQAIVQQDPAVASVAGFTGGRALNTANVFIELKPLAERKLSATQVVNRLRPKLNAVSGAQAVSAAAQDLRIGGRQSAAEYQYTLTSDDTNALFTWVPKLVAALTKDRSQITDVNSDLQQNGLQIYVNMHRATAARYNFAPNQIDNVLYDAFGQRTVSTIYNQINQYFVVMEVAPQYWQYPQMLDRIRFQHRGRQCHRHGADADAVSTVTGVTPVTAVSAQSSSAATNASNANAEANQLTNSISNSKGGSSSGSADSTAAETLVPYPALASSISNHTATQVSHQGGLVAATISFNLPPGGSLSKATAEIDQTSRQLGCRHPSTATMRALRRCMRSPCRACAAHPRRTRRGLHRARNSLRKHGPSAHHSLDAAIRRHRRDAGAVDFRHAVLGHCADRRHSAHRHRQENAIMMIDVALAPATRGRMEPRKAIHDAAVVRLRPIMMTTAAAVLGAVPLAIGIGQGASLRQPLGITVMGGLILSQVFTLYTTPVIYLYLDRLRARSHAGPPRCRGTEAATATWMRDRTRAHRHE